VRSNFANPFVRIGLVGLLAGMIPLRALAVKPSEPEKIVVGQTLARLSLLKPGVHRYLRYSATGSKREAIDIWSRTISFAIKDGRGLMHITQRWDEVGTPQVFVEQDSWFEANTFRPLTHVKTVSRDHKVQIGGYQFLPDQIVGLKDLRDNVRKDFAIASPEPAYNFEYDMELLQALPLATGYQASVDFYDPGVEPPARYIFTVAGSSRIAGPDGHLLDSWVVTADYNTDHVVSRFWFDKRTQVLIREEQARPDGSVVVKALLPPEAEDEERF
jgi:hypothetical protein